MFVIQHQKSWECFAMSSFSRFWTITFMLYAPPIHICASRETWHQNCDLVSWKMQWVPTAPVWCLAFGRGVYKPRLPHLELLHHFFQVPSLSKSSSESCMSPASFSRQNFTKDPICRGISNSFYKIHLLSNKWNRLRMIALPSLVSAHPEIWSSAMSTISPWKSAFDAFHAVTPPRLSLKYVNPSLYFWILFIISLLSLNYSKVLWDMVMWRLLFLLRNQNQ